MKHPDYYLVHANIAIAREPLDHPVMQGFMDLADEIDALGQRSPGFISQPVPEDEGAVYTGNQLLNLSIWDSVEDLRAFTHSGEHLAAMGHRAEWFVQGEQYNYVLYWEKRGVLPSEREVARRLTYLRQHGPTPFAFTFDKSYSVEETGGFL